MKQNPHNFIDRKYSTVIKYMAFGFSLLSVSSQVSNLLCVSGKPLGISVLPSPHLLNGVNNNIHLVRLLMGLKKSSLQVFSTAPDTRVTNYPGFHTESHTSREALPFLGLLITQPGTQVHQTVTKQLLPPKHYAWATENKVSVLRGREGQC